MVACNVLAITSQLSCNLLTTRTCLSHSCNVLAMCLQCSCNHLAMCSKQGHAHHVLQCSQSSCNVLAKNGDFFFKKIRGGVFVVLSQFMQRNNLHQYVFLFLKMLQPNTAYWVAYIMNGIFKRNKRNFYEFYIENNV